MEIKSRTPLSIPSSFGASYLLAQHPGWSASFTRCLSYQYRPSLKVEIKSHVSSSRL
jgi:hypothetical protein